MNKEIEIKNAKIEDTFLGVEDHGILTFMLYLDYGGCGQAAGSYSLGSGNPRQYSSCEIIEKILEIAEAEKWEDLNGKFIRVKCEWNKVHEIGHPLKDKWLNFAEFFKKRTD